MANGEGTLRIQELLVSLGKCLTVHNAPLGDVRGLNNMIVHERCRNCVECTMYMKACNFSCLKIISEFQEGIEPKTCITLVGCLANACSTRGTLFKLFDLKDFWVYPQMHLEVFPIHYSFMALSNCLPLVAVSRVYSGG